MAVKLHRCSLTWLKTGGHSCWRVETALQEKGIEYEVVKEPGLPKSRRKEVIEKTGQTALPVLELEEGRWVRKESKELAAEIRSGALP